MAAFSGWCATRWAPAFIPAVLFVCSAVALLYLSARPPVQVAPNCLIIGKQQIPWRDIRRVDGTGWVSPLVLRLVVAGNRTIYLIYPGDLDSSNSLLRHIRRNACEALLDGIPYRQFWGDDAPSAERRNLASPRYRLLRPEDEAEVERLYQRLKSVGRFDPKNPEEE